MSKKNDKLSQLKKLSAIKADNSWVHSTKYELLSEIDSQNRLMKAQRLSASEKVDMYFSKVLNNVVPTFSRVIAGFLIIAMGSGFSMAAQASVPGQPLWPVKRSIEKVELSLTSNPVKETELYMKHINKRLDEIDKILSDQNVEPEKIVAKEKAITQAISHLEKDVTSVDSSLKIVKTEKTPIETVVLAKKIKEAIKETSNNLEKQAQESGDVIIEEALNKASKTNKEAGDSIIALAVEVHEALIIKGLTEEPAGDIVKETVKEPAGDVIKGFTEEPAGEPIIVLNPTKVDLEEVQAVADIVREMIAGEIEDLATDIKEVKEKVDAVQAVQEEHVSDVAEGIIKTEEEIADDVETESDLVSEEATEKLDEAKVLLEEGSLRDAADKIIESKEIKEKTVEAIEKIETNNEDAEGSVTEEKPQETGDSKVEDSEQSQGEESNEEVGDTTSSSVDIVVEPVDDPAEEYEVEASNIEEEVILPEEN